MRRPRIAVILDENTSGDATRYEAGKGYFRSIRDAGGLPFGIPYLPEMVEPVVAGFDGLLSVGGRFAYPDGWYVQGGRSQARPSERFAVEKAMMEGCLARGRPVLGICAGMQMLACLHGCRLTPDLSAFRPGALDHDGRGQTHAVRIEGGSQLAACLGRTSLEVNTFHREAVAAIPPGVVASAHADDGIVEAIEIPDRPFAIGLQWHQERYAGTDHPGNAVFGRFVEAARRNG